MRIRPDQLAQNLQQLAPCYLIHGDEPLLLQELGDEVRQAAKAQDFLDRDLFHVEGRFDWQQISAADQAMSLFASRKIVEIRIPSGKPGKDGGATLLELAQNPNPDNLVLVVAGKMDAAAQKTKWYKAFESNGTTIPVYPLEIGDMPRWIKQRANKLGLQIDPAAAQLLAQRTEGNLLATAQELEKFTLRTQSTPISVDEVADDVGGHARYSSFQLIDEALNQNPQRALTILNGLREEGSEPLAILWVFTREVRTISKVISHSGGIQAGLDQARIWPKKRLGIMQKAASSHNASSVQLMLDLCLRIDQSSKGASHENVWVLLSMLTLSLAKSPVNN
ncbi:MAG TPA: DNA polymerase III subunit delta [Oceanospirillaceae bacterium]|nr:DNA polymerase III subunit delta [Oceanospirillaceae bacterium]